jgi:hypothetical protein
MDESVIARFWSRVDKATGDQCWEWRGARNERGYGVAWNGKRTRLAHRMAWEIAYHREPSDCVCHRCDNPACCNLAHLFEGSRADNLADMRAKGRAAPMPRRDMRGENHTGAKLTAATVREIRRMLDAGNSQWELALRFGVAPSNISAIATRRSWRHIV